MDIKNIIKEVKGKKNSSNFEMLVNDTEEGLITAYEYSDPNIFLPLNPAFRAIKKIILFVMKAYTKTQVVFNKNVFYVLNRLYLQNLELNNKVNRLEDELRKIKKNEKNRPR